MQAGQLRHRITITSPTPATQNSFGEDVVAVPTEIGTFWCLVEPLQGREKEEAMQRWAEARYKITMRHQTGISFSPKMTANWNGVPLDILDCNDDVSTLRPVITMIARTNEG